MKYVVVSAIENKKPGEQSAIRYPIIFPNNLVHAHIGKLLCVLISFMHPTREVKVTSAGEVNSMDFTGEAYGKSDSIGVKSAPGDQQLISMNDYGSGMLEM